MCQQKGSQAENFDTFYPFLQHIQIIVMYN